MNTWGFVLLNINVPHALSYSYTSLPDVRCVCSSPRTLDGSFCVTDRRAVAVAGVSYLWHYCCCSVEVAGVTLQRAAALWVSFSC